MFLAPAALALLLAQQLSPDLSAVSARFGTPAMVLRGDSFQLTPDGKLATDGETWIDLATEKEVPAPMPGVGRRLQLLLGDGNFVLDGNRSITRHSGKTGEQLSTVDTGDGRVIDPSGRKLARRLNDDTGNRVEVADWPTGDKPPAWEILATTAGRVGVVFFNPSGSHLIWTQSPPKNESGGTTVWVCDVSTGKAVRLQRNPARGNLAGLAVSGDGKLATVISAADTDVFDAATGEFLRSAPHPARRPHTGYGYPHPTFTPDGKFLLACELHSGKLSRIPTDPKGEIGFVDVSDGDGVEKFALTPDGERAVVLDETGVVRVYDLASGKRTDAGSLDTWIGVAWAGEQRAVCWSRRGRVALWDTRTGKREKDWVIGKPAADSSGVGWVKVSADGLRLAVNEYGAKQNRLRVFDLGTGKAMLELTDKFVRAATTFHPAGDRIGVATVVREETHSLMTFRVFTLADGRERTMFRELGGTPAFTPDGRSVLVFTNTWENGERDDWVRCVEVASGGTRWTWKGKWDDGLAGGNEYVGTASDGTPVAARGSTVRGFDPLTGRVCWEIDRPGLAHLSEPQYASSPDGRWLAVTAAVDGLRGKKGGWFELFDLDSQAGRDRPRVSPVVPGALRAVAVSADGGRVLSLSDTGEQMVWDVSKLRRGEAGDLPADVWADLRGEAEPAAAAMAVLASNPERAVKLLAEKLPAVAEADADAVKKWIAELGSADFNTRDAAEKSLVAVLDPARKLIRSAAENPANEEATDRLERLVKKIDGLASQPEYLRVSRAVEVVERLRTPAAVKLLERWAGGTPDALLTTEAKASLRRVKR